MTDTRNPNMLKPALDETFRFRIGDLVSPRNEFEAYRAEESLNAKNPHTYERLRGPMPAVVRSRLVEECHGGVQVFYGFVLSRPDGAEVYVKMTEMEVVPYEETLDVFRRMAVARDARSGK